MNIVRLVIGGGFALLAIFLIYDIVRRYRASDGKTWDRLVAAGHDSAVILWAKIGLIFSAAVENADTFADLIQQPQLKPYIAEYFTPQLVGGVLAVCFVISWVARKRTL